MRATAHLALGSNEGDRLDFLRRARRELEVRAGDIVRQSRVFESPALTLDASAGPPYLNQVLELATNYRPHKLLFLLAQIEDDLGRQRFEKWGDRTIDLDVLFYAHNGQQQIIATPNLTVPHPELAQRRFVLEPLVEIAPELVHPLAQTSVAELLALCADPNHLCFFDDRP